ncbi:hypothetical protein BD289DRAFT_379853 [Coniella lustricola]|uniref:Neutral/alkaline non-lysosomal ceramidase N-terminal domain-containing protein n=1 Tax=Coniella lustricola TaxID=2025994 RepID=A0A2T2ZS51_9PEZI|nr:hypothetical protein BD289DRAFT_379853 [Coniella lustricola]
MLASSASAASNSSTSTGLLVGTARVDITPYPNPNWLPLDEFDHEKLHVRAIVFENDGVRGAFINCEVAFIQDAVYKSTNALVADALGTTGDHVLVSITHAHSAGPAGVTNANTYGNAGVRNYSSLATAALNAAQQALASMTPAKVGYQTGEAFFNVNRDSLNPFTGRWTQAGNLSGPVDREVQVLTFLGVDDNAPLASVNDTFVAIYSQQASGDVNPLLRRAGTNNLASISSVPITGFELVQECVEEPIRDGYTPLARPDDHYIRQLFNELYAQGVMMGEIIIHIMSRTTEWDASPSIWARQRNVTCPGRLRLDGAREGVPGVYTDGPDINILTGVLGLGDMVLVHVGGEIFTRIGWRIKNETTMNKTMLVTMTNGQSASGYIPDTDSWNQETFQVLGSKLMPGSCAELNISSSLTSMVAEYKAMLG